MAAEPFLQPLRVTADKQIFFSVQTAGAQQRLLKNGAHGALPFGIKRG